MAAGLGGSFLNSINQREPHSVGESCGWCSIGAVNVGKHCQMQPWLMHWAQTKTTNKKTDMTAIKSRQKQSSSGSSGRRIAVKLPKGQRTCYTCCFPTGPMLSRLQKGKNNIMRTQNLWFSCYMRVWWMCQCLLLVNTENLKKIKFLQEKCLDMNINISSTAGKHLILWRDQQRILQQWEHGGFESAQYNRDICLILRSGSTSVINFYILWIIASAGCSNFNHFSFTTFLLRRGNFLTPAVYFWYCSK